MKKKMPAATAVTKILKMKGDRWTRELELGLVKLYKNLRCLWMMSLPAYNDLDRRYAAYVRIVEALRPEFCSLTVPKVVYKIRDLRYRYCVELTKIERAAACGENYKPNVSWFKVMHSFLDLRFRIDENQDSQTFTSEKKLQYDYNGTRLSSSTCQTIYENHLKMEESKSTVGEFEESGNDAENCGDVYDQICGSKEAKEFEDVKEIQDLHFGDFFKDQESLDLKMQKNITKTLLSDMKNLNSKLTKKTAMTNQYDDEFNAFAMSIGSQLKTLDPKLITKLEIIILMILNEERMKSEP